MKALITSVGRRVALVEHMKENFEVWGADCDPCAPALRFVYDPIDKIPEVQDPNYFIILGKILKREKINLVIPTIDSELEKWARLYTSTNLIEKYISDTYVSISPLITIQTCLDKQRLQYFFLDNFPDNFPKNWVKGYPAFVKPRYGNGSREAYRVESGYDLDYYIHCYGNEDMIIQKYLEGQEFTVDCFFSRENQLISYVPRYREIIRAGVCDRGLTFESEKIEKLILQISDKLPFEGAVNFQGKLTGDGIKFFEINPRFSGGIQLSIAAGFNPSLWLRMEMEGDILVPELGQFQKNLRMMSYEKSIIEVAK